MSSRRHGQQSSQWLHYTGGSCGAKSTTTHHRSSTSCGGGGSHMMNACTAGPQGAAGASISADVAYLGRETMPFSALGLGPVTFEAAEMPLFFANAPNVVVSSFLLPSGGIPFASSAFVTNKAQRVTALHVNFDTVALSAGVESASIAVYYRLPGDANLSPPIAVVDLFALDVNEHGFVELAPGVDLPEGTQVSVGIAIAGAVPPVTISFNAVSAGIRL